MRSIVLAAGLFALAGSASAKTFVFPHFVEKTGFITNTQFTFDTNFYMAYTAGLAGTDPGPSGHFDLYFFEPDGSPTTNSSATICGPCSYDLSAVRKVGVRVESQMLVAGPLDT